MFFRYKKFDVALVLLLSLFVFCNSSNVLAASGSLSVSSNDLYVGDSFTVTVNVFSAASWNVHVMAVGPVSECIINEVSVTTDVQNNDKTFSTTCTATDKGEITITLSGDATSSSSTVADPLSSTQIVTVSEKTTPQPDDGGGDQSGDDTPSDPTPSDSTPSENKPAPNTPSGNTDKKPTNSSEKKENTDKRADMVKNNVDTSIEITYKSKYEKEISELANNADGLFVTVSQPSDSPKNTKQKVYVGSKFKDGDNLFVYVYDKSKGKLVLVNKGLKVNKGNILFDTTKGTDYFITKTDLFEDGSNYVETIGADTEENSNLVPVIIASVIIGLIVASGTGFVIWFFLKKKKNNDKNNNTNNTIDTTTPPYDNTNIDPTNGLNNQ